MASWFLFCIGIYRRGPKSFRGRRQGACSSASAVSVTLSISCIRYLQDSDNAQLSFGILRPIPQLSRTMSEHSLIWLKE